MNGLTSAISSQMRHMFATAMTSYGISTTNLMELMHGLMQVDIGFSKEEIQ